ncbi:PD-(D/E)XK nuclease family protein [Infirmifilum sp. NZ]|uniref:PD-(D/E)XK nuclease family protein n=1 Tax=Infirmifilum sp. NZ TaxID=2926850 RepID=UPI0027A93127|nr:DUF3782 domain-containing protein [Infirmifilum sp. NZ]UNQ73163.1 DUF3782 domain-containing protein [Infirmifilum sp. NZ]
MELVELKSRVLRLLREDEEFRYAVAGLIGLDEVLRRLDRHEERMVKLEERMLKVEEELVKLREDMIRGFERHDKEIAELRQEMNKLREDMNKGFEIVNRHISALGARWGILAEEAFREGLRGVLEKEFGFKVERWSAYDEKGRVFGYPSEVELDVTIKDGKIILIEVASHVRASDIYEFKRKAELYVEKTGNKPEKLMVVTPYIEEKAIEASKKLGIEVYTKV